MIAADEVVAVPGGSARDPRMLAMFAAAADPYERGAEDWCRRVDTPESTIEARRVRWTSAVSNGDEAGFLRLLDARGIDAERFTAMLSDVEVRTPDRLPRWAVACLDVLEGAADPVEIHGITIGELYGDSLPADVEGGPNAPWSLHDAHAVLLAAAIRFVRALVESVDIEIAPAVERQLVLTWVRRVAEVTVPTLWSTPAPVAGGTDAARVLDASVQELDLDGHADRDAWIGVLATYPVLARLIGTIFHFWRDSVVELIQRVSADSAMLSERFADGSDIGALALVDTDAGDAHRGGRTVAILTFESGVRLVYKPKDLHVGAAVLELVRDLTATAGRAELRPRTIVPMGPYTWEEHVPTTDAQTGGPARFYYRYGALARIVQQVGGHDITCENVIAHGEHPEIIDLETMFRPRSRLGSGISALDRVVRQRMHESAMSTGMFTGAIVADMGRRAVSASPLRADESWITPFRQRRVEREADGRVRLVWDYVAAPRVAPIPRVDGVRVEPRDYFDDVATGYADMDTRLRGEADRLTSAAGPLASMADHPVRFLNRNTHIYVRVLQQSVRPDRLGDGVQREIELDKMWKALSVDPHGAPFIADEVNALRQYDVPMVQSLPGSGDAILNDGSVAADAFDGAALPAAMRAIRDSSDRADDRDVAVVRTLLHCLDPRADTSTLADPTARPRRAGLHDALGIGRLVVEHALRADGRVNWLGLAYTPWHDLWGFGGLPTDLLSGAVGIGVTIAELAVVCDDRELRMLAHEILETLCWRLDQSLDEFAVKRRLVQTAPRSVFVVGGLTSVGSQLHGIAHMATLLDDDAARSALRAAIERIDLVPVRALARDDMIGGRAGLLLNLLGVARCLDDETLTASIDDLSAQVGTPELRAAPIPDGAWISGEVPDAEDAVRWSVAVATSSSTVSSAEVDPRPDTTFGATLLAATEPLSDIAVAYLGRPEWSRMDRQPTRELLKCSEVARVAARRDPERSAEADDAVLDELVRRHDRCGSWFPDLRVEDRHHLSAIFGVCAIARALVAARGELAVPSLRLLEPGG